MKLSAPTLLLDLFTAHHRSGQLVELAIRDTQLSADEYAVISYLGREGPATPTEMSRALGLYLTTTLFRVGKLEERGLVKRTANPDDRRSFIVSLTRRGEAKWEKGRVELRKLLARVERRLGDADAVLEAILRLSEAIDAEVTDRPLRVKRAPRQKAER